MKPSKNQPSSSSLLPSSDPCNKFVAVSASKKRRSTDSCSTDDPTKKRRRVESKSEVKVTPAASKVTGDSGEVQSKQQRLIIKIRGVRYDLGTEEDRKKRIAKKIGSVKILPMTSRDGVQAKQGRTKMEIKRGVEKDVFSEVSNLRSSGDNRESRSTPAKSVRRETGNRRSCGRDSKSADRCTPTDRKATLLKRERERRAARAKIEGMTKTVDLFNMEIMGQLDRMFGDYDWVMEAFYGGRRENPLRKLGLIVKDK